MNNSFLLLSLLVAATPSIAAAAATSWTPKTSPVPPHAPAGYTLDDAPVPNPDNIFDEYIVDLDLAPEERWKPLIRSKRRYIMAVLQLLRRMFYGSAPEFTENFLANAVVPEEYRREMIGISEALNEFGYNTTYEDALLAGAYYEISGAEDPEVMFADYPEFKVIGGAYCTSMVANAPDGTVMLARNQDYPPPFIPLMVHVKFTRGGVVVYEGTTYAGIVGIDTGGVPGGWGVSINARGSGAQQSLDDRLEAIAKGASIFPFIVREAMDAGCVDFECALAFYSTKEMVRNGYLILAGARSGEGVVLARNAKPEGSDAFFIKDAYPEGGDEGSRWFAVQTNTDWWDVEAPFPDWWPSEGAGKVRRDTAIAGMEKIGADSIDLDGMYGVLSTKPVFNFATIHTNLINPAKGEHVSYKRVLGLA